MAGACASCGGRPKSLLGRAGVCALLLLFFVVELVVVGLAFPARARRRRGSGDGDGAGRTARWQGGGGGSGHGGAGGVTWRCHENEWLAASDLVDDLFLCNFGWLCLLCRQVVSDPGVVVGWQPAPDFQTLLRGMNRWLVSSLVARVQQGREAELVYMSCVARCAITKTGIKQAKHGG